MKKVKVDPDEYDEKVKPLLKEEMSYTDVSMLGHTLIKQWFGRVKSKLLFWRKNP